MSRLFPLPQIMLAPNGARRKKADHPAIPLTIEDTVHAAMGAFAQGARALHAHVHSAEERHVLDAALYRELIREMALHVPDMPVQITTEAVGRYTPDTMRRVVERVRPEGVSVGLAEMWPDNRPDPEASAFYHGAVEQGIAVQHILYTPEQVTRLARLVADRQIPGPVQCLFVLGRYDPTMDAKPVMLDRFLTAAQALPEPPDWAVCAFGPGETECLLAALQKGGKARIGFENNLIGADGRRAADNAARVRDLRTRWDQLSGRR